MAPMQTRTETLDLDNPAQSGVFLVTDEDLQRVAAADHAPATCVRHVHLQGHCDPPSVVAAFDQVLDGPAPHAQRWEALGERLHDLSWLPAQGYVLLVSGAGDLHAAHPVECDRLLDVLDDAAARWAQARIPFFAFVTLPGEPPRQDENREVFELRGEHIALNRLLKLVGVCDSGGAGKALVASGAVHVDGHLELRKTRKIQAGQRVEVDGRCILVRRADH